MNPEDAFVTSLEYERKIRDIYRSALDIIKEDTGRVIFQTLADDEQSHVDFLKYSLEELKDGHEIDLARLKTALPPTEMLEQKAAGLKKKIPEKVYGDVKRILNSALEIEIETSQFYKQVMDQTEEPVKSIFRKFLEIENGHIDAVQIELDYASGSGFWFNFMEIDLED